MKKVIAAAALLLIGYGAFAQEEAADTSWEKIYRESSPKINDLIHTKLDIRFDYSKSQAIGKVWLQLKPHFYATDSLLLDAKGMEIQQVAVVKNNKNQVLNYDYNGLELRIKLDKSYKKEETYTIYVSYIAKPNDYKAKGSAAITDAKGLYFINPLGEDKTKPTQIWTQGETEGTSVWVPIIDKPNQKCTQEFNLTVPAKYVSLSNGKLVSQKKNSDGTRTDTWKMDQPHSPYLFFIGVGDYAIVKDSYKGKEISYYVEKEYESVARKIFGLTPEMMAFYSRITGIDYPWVKYAQITGRDYVSGAMENTTTTLHGESAQQDARELVDGNQWEGVVAHELFHHWFGDYVTAESWSNLTVNESFANYSEVLWYEYKWGKDAADAHNYSDMVGYLSSGSEKKDLVRFHYADREDMFDAVSYNKGGRILHMLRNYVGDSAFFKALNLYLTTNKYKAAEAHHLRLAFEEVTGKDLNWFFNQWYYGSGHPKLSVDYIYDEARKEVAVIVKQTQAGDKVFKLPVAIDLYYGSKKERKNVWIDDKNDTFVFKYSTRPDLINFDGDKILLAEKKDNKTLDQYLFQMKNAGLYMDRREAIEAALKKQSEPKAWEIISLGLKDPSSDLRGFTLGRLDIKKESIRSSALPIVEDMAKNDKKTTVKAVAIDFLSVTENPDYKALYQKGLSDSSYSVAGASLEALYGIDPDLGLAEAKKVPESVKGRLQAARVKILIQSGDPSVFETVALAYKNMPISQDKFEMTQALCDMLAKVTDTKQLKEGVDLVVAFRKAIPEQYGITPVINNFLKGIVTKKEAQKEKGGDKASLQEQIDYIKSKM
ncbi:MULTISPECIES: M1 family aminopeptidase [unclassified Paraflavitalea]|uniref:M1 family aminopeptidase n=1 Tax=unclassified Paraflavitalea TaxID=2798305 RepID=UPI003D33F04F